MRKAVCLLAIAAAAGMGSQAPSLAQRGQRLPLAEGVWVDARMACPQARTIFVHAGGRFGELNYFEGRMEGEFSPVAPAPAEEGFISAVENDDGYLRVRSSPNGRTVIRSGSVGATGRDHFSDVVVRQCPTNTLPAELRSALAPYLGDSAASAQPAAAPGAADRPGPAVPPLGIAAGYYAEGAEPCGGNGILFYYDGRNYAWIDQQPFQRSRLDPVGQPRRVRGAWAIDGAFMTVSSPTRFIWRDLNAGIGDTEHRWCPASQVRESARLR